MFLQKLDEVDAAVFSGDALEAFSNRKILREHCERWLRALDERRTTLIIESDSFSLSAEATDEQFVFMSTFVHQWNKHMQTRLVLRVP